MYRTLALLLLLSTAPVQAQPLTINENDAQITFVFTDNEVDGSISGFDFTGHLDLNDLDGSTISGSVVTKTLDTNNWLRDRSLRTKKYFNTKQFPALNYTSKRISDSGSALLVHGNLTIKGVSKPVTFTFQKAPTRLIGTAAINVSDFNIKIYKDRSRNTVHIRMVLPYTSN